MEYREEIMAGVMTFWNSRIVLTGAELDIFTRVDERPATSEQIAVSIGTDRRATDRLLNALAALGLLMKEGEVFHLTVGGRIFSALHPETILPMMLHFNQLWHSWSRLTEVVKTGEPVKRVGGERGEANRRSFVGAMHAISRKTAREIADAFDASPFNKLLDVGGASGTYTIAFLQKNPRLSAALFDLPPVVTLAREQIEAEGLTERVTFVTGDFYTDELPAGCDLALLSAVIHQNSGSQNLDLYHKAYRALEAGGSILIRDHVMDESRTSPVAGALFAVNMLVGTAGGDCYTFQEIQSSLEKAGFTDVTWIRKGEQMDSLIQAKKPR